MKNSETKKEYANLRILKKHAKHMIYQYEMF